ncbi:D-tyrosyl-tRNA(Tyr) deacylase [Wenzhouxiangella sp. AB-CW3]|uniref:D-aminoacyl-tRNA deacylase n=1 Tax=Wenzhouxiangella sp. AB-CW3 TaxID=2771012 RepID=UPI00168AC00D|nr:D-aminoacyl-tRNA deacylase [Wenzhouxiangella sp. AB-CW3]QOC22282.1 D-tyrosyl-tRNA(Tyr) deacylase [Wenzhouxiangella sp. AB-CW3]
MIGLIQRVSGASVDSEGERLGSIGPGLLVLVGFRKGDRSERIPRFVERLINYRVFPDEAGRMNRSLQDIGGGLLLVPQFTLAADTNSGNRPSFTPAAPPEEGRALFDQVLERAASIWPHTAAGRFGADMQVRLVNDGPVTFWIEVE